MGTTGNSARYLRDVGESLTVGFFCVDAQLIVLRSLVVRVKGFGIDIAIDIERQCLVLLLRVTQLNVLCLHIGCR